MNVKTADIRWNKIDSPSSGNVLPTTEGEIEFQAYPPLVFSAMVHNVEDDLLVFVFHCPEGEIITGKPQYKLLHLEFGGILYVRIMPFNVEIPRAEDASLYNISTEPPKDIVDVFLQFEGGRNVNIVAKSLAVKLLEDL